MSISVVILNYNGKDILRRCVDSVIKQTRPPDSLIVVDNNSTDTSWKLVEDDITEVVFANNKHKFITGLNKAFEVAKDAWVMFMENDVILHADCLKKMMDVRADIMNPAFYDEQGRKFKSSPFCFLTACFMMRKSTFEFVGEFDKKLAPAYYEDVDYSIRAKRFGFKIKKDIGKAIHLANWSFSKVYTKESMSKMCRKNFWYVLKKHLPVPAGFDIMKKPTNVII